MVSLNGFDANTVAPHTPFEVLPQGDYLAILDSSEMKPTKAGNGSYFELVFQIIEGEHKGRKLWERMTWTNPSDKAQSIGRAQMSSLCRAIGVMTPRDTSDLHNRPLILKVGHEKRDDNGELVNRVKEYKPAQPVGAGAGNIAGVVVNGTSKPATAVAPPWAK